MGQPTEPCVCSKLCSDALFKGIGKTMEQRRIDAGIEVWMTPRIGNETEVRQLVKNLFNAGMAKWQTQKTQNLPPQGMGVQVPLPAPKFKPMWISEIGTSH